MPSPRTLILVILMGVAVGLGIYLYQVFRTTGARRQFVRAFLSDSLSDSRYVIQAGSRCGDAPFLFPTTGVVGFLWDDSFRFSHRHQGIDIFAGTDIDVTKVVAAYPGFLTRLPEWRSAVIVRVPSDPLEPGRQIWVYYTHMADPNGNSFISSDFPPGTYEKPVEAGAFLGYQGDYSGDPNNPVGVHLHVSIVKDKGGQFMNELDINNTYDPSPYFGLALNAKTNPGQIPVCTAGTNGG